MRFVIDVVRTDDDRVEGLVTSEGRDHAVRFSGWLELLHLLEPPVDGGAGSEGRRGRPADAAGTSWSHD